MRRSHPAGILLMMQPHFLPTYPQSIFTEHLIVLLNTKLSILGLIGRNNLYVKVISDLTSGYKIHIKPMTSMLMAQHFLCLKCLKIDA